MMRKAHERIEELRTRTEEGCAQWRERTLMHRRLQPTAGAPGEADGGKFVQLHLVTAPPVDITRLEAWLNATDEESVEILDRVRTRMGAEATTNRAEVMALVEHAKAKKGCLHQSYHRKADARGRPMARATAHTVGGNWSTSCWRTAPYSAQSTGSGKTQALRRPAPATRSRSDKACGRKW